ncbi:MAG: HNH endonuclease [Desulfobacterales bacterium]|nr:HNH endonuclease [Desulfobacterales bacterium]
MKEFCPFCDISSDRTSFTKEHIMPDALGGTLTIRICKNCNDKLGSKVDSPLVNSELIKLTKYAAGTKIKKEAVNPFQKAYIANDITAKIRIELDSENKPYIRYMPKAFKVIEKNGEKYVDNIIVDERDYCNLPKMINKFLKRKGYSEIENEDIYNSLKITDISENPVVANSFKFKSFDYYPCLCKIAYETAWMFFKDEYLKDKCGLRLRQAINDIIKNRCKPNRDWAITIQNLIRFMPERYDGRIADICPKYSNMILLKYIEPESKFCVYISILGIITAFITVSESPDRYNNIDFMYVNDYSQGKSWRGNSAEVIYNLWNLRNVL